MTSSKNYTKVKVKSMFQSGKHQNNITSKGIVTNRILEDNEIFSDHKVCLDNNGIILRGVMTSVRKNISVSIILIL